MTEKIQTTDKVLDELMNRIFFIHPYDYSSMDESYQKAKAQLEKLMAAARLDELKNRLPFKMVEDVILIDEQRLNKRIAELEQTLDKEAERE